MTWEMHPGIGRFKVGFADGTRLAPTQTAYTWNLQKVAVGPGMSGTASPSSELCGENYFKQAELMLGRHKRGNGLIGVSFRRPYELVWCPCLGDIRGTQNNESGH